MFIDMREEGRETETQRNTVGERETPIGCLPQAANQQPSPQHFVCRMVLQLAEPPCWGSLYSHTASRTSRKEKVWVI